MHAVITAADAPPTLLGKNLHDMPMLANDRVRYVGEKIAVVAAESRQAAEAALAAIAVEYEELPVVSNIEDAIRPGTTPLHPERASYAHSRDYPDFPRTSRT